MSEIVTVPANDLADMQRRIRELEQRLAVVWGLPDKWLNSAGADHADTHILSDNGFMTIIECADELRAALRGSDE